MTQPGAAIAVISPGELPGSVPGRMERGARGRRKASFRNAFHLHFYNKTSKF